MMNSLLSIITFLPLIGAVVLTGLAARLGAPYPAFLAIGGIGLASCAGRLVDDDGGSQGLRAHRSSP